MAPRFSRRRRDHEESGDGPGSDDEEARLDSAEHAWWAERDIDRAWAPRADRPSTDADSKRDVLAEHFGEDWRTSFGYAPAPAAPLASAEEPADPYAVLGVDASASWEEVVEARREVVRRHHPDRVAGMPEAERLAAEERIRTINAAFAELKVRRGKS